VAVAVQAPAQDDGGPKVSEHGVGTAVEDRDLEGRKATFAEGERAFFWTLVEGGEAGDRITHVWLREGEEMLSVGLAIGGPRWRTWSNKTLHPGSAGSWAVEARDTEGRVLARDEFTCAAAASGE
jgi:hypothetical protein